MFNEGGKVSSRSWNNLSAQTLQANCLFSECELHSPALLPSDWKTDINYEHAFDGGNSLEYSFVGRNPASSDVFGVFKLFSFYQFPVPAGDYAFSYSSLPVSGNGSLSLLFKFINDECLIFTGQPPSSFNGTLQVLKQKYAPAIVQLAPPPTTKLLGCWQEHSFLFPIHQATELRGIYVIIHATQDESDTPIKTLLGSITLTPEIDQVSALSDVRLITQENENAEFGSFLVWKAEENFSFVDIFVKEGWIGRCYQNYFPLDNSIVKEDIFIVSTNSYGRRQFRQIKL